MKKRILSAALAVAIMLCSLLSLAGCRDGREEPPTPTPTGPATYTVKITTEYGLPLSGISFIIHNEASASPSSSVERLETDLNGCASVELDTAKVYSVKILYPDAGFKPEEKYLFNSERHAEVKVKTAPIEGGLENLDGYSLGDVVHNFGFTDINGAELSVASALSNNKLLILNFWFAGCGPCRSEFPTLISAYEKYRSAGVELFAIDDNGDPIGTIRDYRVDYKGESVVLPFPTVKGDVGDFGRCELITAFGGNAYPFTVFIDRAGMICYVHEGIISAQVLESLIEHFTSDDYEARLGTDIFG